MPSTSILVADLTPSIRQILQGYGKESLFKEILQNSDDAGATEQVSRSSPVWICRTNCRLRNSLLIAERIQMQQSSTPS